MLFGKKNEYGLRLNKKGLIEVVKVGENGVTKDDILVHNATEDNPILHWQLANMAYPDFPIALGVIRKVAGKTYEKELERLIDEKKEHSTIKCMEDLLHSGDTWKV